MPKLVTTPNIDRPDDFYAALLALHEGRGKEDSDAVNARLRRELIVLHEMAENRVDTKLHREIIALYVKMAEARRLDLPPLPGS